MKLKHAKSPCCGASIQRFGQRRRRCAKCHSTWRIRKKKRGRKQKRTHSNLALSYLQKSVPSIREIAKRRKCGKDSVQVRLQRSLKFFVKQEKEDWWKSLKNISQLIAIADAIWYRVKGQPYTIYIILLRPINETQAIICPPIIVSGHESFNGWKQSFDSLPVTLKRRIIALICDGAVTLVTLAQLRNWIIQRCHFHLIASIQNYLGASSRSKQRAYGFYVLKIVQQLLQINDPEKTKRICQKLCEIRQRSKSRGLRRVLSGLLTNYRDYQTYLDYPELNLPTTSNSAESFIQCIRDLMYRCRGFRSLSTLTNWLTALSLFKKTIRCNGKKSTKLNR